MLQDASALFSTTSIFVIQISFPVGGVGNPFKDKAKAFAELDATVIAAAVYEVYVIFSLFLLFFFYV